MSSDFAVSSVPAVALPVAVPLEFLLTAWELVGLSSAYAENLAPAAKEAAFEGLDEEVAVDDVDSNKQLAAAAITVRASEDELLGASEATVDDSNVWELACSEDDDLLLTSLC